MIMLTHSPQHYYDIRNVLLIYGFKNCYTWSCDTAVKQYYRIASVDNTKYSLILGMILKVIKTN